MTPWQRRMSNTPILDREQPLPEAKKSKLWLRLLVGLAIGSVIGGAIGAVLAFLDVDFDRLAAFLPGRTLLLGFLPGFYLGVLLHELGHVAAGLSVGFELRSLMVGAFLLTRETRGWKVRFIPRRILAGGLANMVPKSADRLVERYFRFVLGGPAASLVLLAVSLILSRIFPGIAGVRVVLLVGVLITISACIPYTFRSQPTDAKLLLLTIRKGPAAERLAAIFYIVALDAQRVEPRDWPRELVEKMSIPTQDKSFLTGVISVRYAHALDSGDPERIAEAIERALAANDEARPDVQRAFYVAASCFHGIFRNNAALAGAWLESARKVKNTASPKDWDAKALASLALAKGVRALARVLLTRSLAVLDRHPLSGMIAAERTRALDLLGRSEGAAA